jgi:hypothetical protein
MVALSRPPADPNVRLGESMTWPRQYSIKLLLLLMVVVAHACSKMVVARSLHTGPIESISTSTPFVITIQYPDDENLNEHTETYLGAFGQYWLYSHRISVVLVQCHTDSATAGSIDNKVAEVSSEYSDCEKGMQTPK